MERLPRPSTPRGAKFTPAGVAGLCGAWCFGLEVELVAPGRWFGCRTIDIEGREMVTGGARRGITAALPGARRGFAFFARALLLGVLLLRTALRAGRRAFFFRLTMAWSPMAPHHEA